MSAPRWSAVPGRRRAASGPRLNPPADSELKSVVAHSSSSHAGGSRPFKSSGVLVTPRLHRSLCHGPGHRLGAVTLLCASATVTATPADSYCQPECHLGLGTCRGRVIIMLTRRIMMPVSH